MAKKKEYEFTVREYIRFCFCSWPILLLCLLCGACAAVYSQISQKTSYGVSMVLLVHEEGTTISGPVSPYIQIPTILASPKSYERIGLSPDRLSFGEIKAQEVAAGVISFEGTSSDSEDIKASMRMIADNAEAAIDAVYTDEKHDYEVTVLKEPGEDIVEHNTRKEKILSVVLIMALSVFASMGINFIIFNKKAKVN
jgi:hypothetical protein